MFLFFRIADYSSVVFFIFEISHIDFRSQAQNRARSVPNGPPTTVLSLLSLLNAGKPTPRTSTPILWLLAPAHPSFVRSTSQQLLLVMVLFTMSLLPESGHPHKQEHRGCVTPHRPTYSRTWKQRACGMLNSAIANCVCLHLLGSHCLISFC